MEKSNKLTPEELAKRLSEAGIEMLVLMNKFDEKSKKSYRSKIQITSFLATVAGFAISLTYFLPEINKHLLSILSVTIGALIVSFSYWQHKKEDFEQISKILNERGSPSKSDEIKAEEYRAALIKKLMREGE